MRRRVINTDVASLGLCLVVVQGFVVIFVYHCKVQRNTRSTKLIHMEASNRNYLFQNSAFVSQRILCGEAT
jgi:hypothetical protein